MKFYAGIENIFSCSWKINNNSVTNESKTFKYRFDKEGTYIVTMNAKIANSKLSVYRVDTVLVHPEPEIEITLSNDTVQIPGKPLTCITKGTKIQKCFWNFGDGTVLDNVAPSYTYKREGEYNIALNIVDVNGCETSLKYDRDIVVISAGSLRFPKLLIPEQSGSNGGYYSVSSHLYYNVFFPKVAKNISKYHLLIFGRSGNLIFETQDINRGWDGYYKNKLCAPGVYVYKVKGTYQNGAPYLLDGDVTLLK